METDMTMLAGATVIGGSLGIYSTLRLIYYIFYMIANWRIFSKAGEPGWKSLIPFYNVYTEYKLQSIWTRFRLWRRTFLPPADLLNDPRIRKRPVPGKSVIKTEYKRWEAGALGGSCFFDAEEIAMKFLSRRTCPKNARTDRYNKIILQMESENKEWGRSREMRTKIQNTWDI